MAYPNEVFTGFSFIGFVLSVIPIYWHLEAWNTGTCMYMIWTALACLILFVNSIVWHHNMIDGAPVYCDIVTRIQSGLGLAIPACSLCINRRLYKIITVKAVMITRSEKRRNVLIDLLICVGIPLIQMAFGEYRPFTPDQLVYADGMQHTLFRDIAITYSRISGHYIRSPWYPKPLFCCTHGLW